MSELPEGVPPAEAPAPTDSASGILLRRAANGRWEVLLGLRSRGSRFMPGQFVFPGGAVEGKDRSTRAGVFARCVSREFEEETALRIPADLWIDAGERITPPMFPLRFRNRFLVAVFPDDSASPAPATDEIEELRFVAPRAALDDWRTGKRRLPPPVLPILRTLAAHDTAQAIELARAIGRANELERRSPRIEFCPDVWMLPVRTETLPPATHTNVWMPGARAFVVVDPGSAESSEKRRLLGVIERRREEGGRPLAVLLTHHHHDHAGGAQELARRLDVPLRAHPSVLDRLAPHGDDLRREPIGDGDEVELMGTTLRALHTPGHAAGHLCFLLVESRVLIAGDVISGLSTILIDPEQGDMEDYLTSLRRLRDLGCSLLLPGHGPPLPASALDRLITHREQREESILREVAAPRTELAHIARGAYADVPQIPRRLTERQALAHLIRLERHGRLRREDDEGRYWSPP